MFPVCRDAKFWWEREGGNGDGAADKNGIIPQISLTVLTAILLGAYVGESWGASWRRVRDSCGLCLEGLVVDSKLSEFSASNPSSLLGPESDTQFNLKIPSPWASLVAQQLRICLLMQATRVRALVWEDPTCHEATGPVSHNCWACAPQQERPR